MREILEARIRDPKTSARDLASLANSLQRLDAPPPPPEGVEVPWAQPHTSALIFFYSVPEGGGPPPDPKTLDLDQAFIAHRLDEGQHLLVFPLPRILEETTEQEAETRAAIDTLNENEGYKESRPDTLRKGSE
jgi:hypothetical protein